MVSAVNCTSTSASQSLTPVICHAVLILCLGSFLLKICFKAQSIGSPGTKIKIFREHVAFSHSIL